MKWAWARWVLFGVNVFAAIGSALASPVAVFFAIGSDVGLAREILVALACLVPSMLFGVLAHQQFHGRGRALQTVLALAALLGAFIVELIFPAIYGAYALLAVWVLGDFVEPVATVNGAPETVARLMLQRGESIEAIRAALADRNVPAADIETLVYALASSRHD